MHMKITMDVETGRKQDTAENHQGNYPQEWNYKLDISKIKKKTIETQIKITNSKEQEP